MKSVTAVGIVEVNINVLLEEQLHYIKLILACGNQERVASEVIG